MKIKLVGISEENIERLTEILVNFGINPTPLYRALNSGLDHAIVECNPEIFQDLKRAINNICQIVPMENQSKPPLPLISLFLDNLLLFYILKLSIYSQDFKEVISYLFPSSKAQSLLQALLSLIFIFGYYYSFIETKSSPPIGRLLGINYQEDKKWIILAYSLPLIGLYLITSYIPLGKLLGLAFLSLSVGIVFYSIVKY